MQDSVSEIALKFYRNTTKATILETPVYTFVLACIGFTLLICLTVVGNTFVLLALYLDKRLHSTSYYLIANMATADLLLGLAVLPFSSVLEILNGKWIFGTSFCTAWLALDVLCCTASINALMAISIDRYIGVTRPLIYSQIMTIKRTIILIIIVWAASTLTSVVPLFGLTDPWKMEPPLPNNETSNLSSMLSYPLNRCEVNKDALYSILSSLISFYIPVIILLILYSRVYQEANKQSKKLENDKRRIYNIDYQIASSQVQMAKQQNISSDDSDHIQQHHTSLKLAQNKKQKERRRSSLQMIRFSLNGEEQTTSLLNNNNSNNNILHEQHDGDDGSMQRTITATDGSNKSPNLKNHTTNDTSYNNSRPHPNPSASRPINKCPSTNSERGGSGNAFISQNDELLIIKRKLHNLKREQKAFRTLGLILGALLICWLPFFVTLPTIAILKALGMRINENTWFKITFWLGYCNSALNPFVYAFSNRAIRRSFQHVLFRKICCCTRLCCCCSTSLCQQKRQKFSPNNLNNSITTQTSINTTRLDSILTHDHVPTMKSNGTLKTKISSPPTQPSHVSFAEMLAAGDDDAPRETDDASYKLNHKSLTVPSKKKRLKKFLHIQEQE
ncbi:unnamed protein product [Didymodactylos carnosus]|uniref:G-protein coupled receptors family 1 profile domain-containing protein n=1 Tax=Didymodactylos carnosus TaxID=1234261 RepID=A0A814N5D1_9BILA|nr:unnamed protein product [Didymodactylos carnosus]CAF1087571.1 unnamed protein product [Didymodactylos carnosus]CAF3515343.1 unnamed protein product [Didymodactylos carnosus]CAF3853094.1 unnamed protein product [Didymodactylos carnosus]